VAVHREVARSLAAYLKAQIQNAVIVMGLYIIAFAITGVPWWVLTGFLCGLLNLVPSIGSILALGLALFAKWLVADDWLPLVYVGCAWLVIQIIDGFVLSPRAAGRAGVNPFLSILITLLAGLLLGPIGMLLAVPVVAVGLVIYRATRGGVRE
jgi:predicted PurR-regulated permease PerM